MFRSGVESPTFRTGTISEKVLETSAKTEDVQIRKKIEAVRLQVAETFSDFTETIKSTKNLPIFVGLGIVGIIVIMFFSRKK